MLVTMFVFSIVLMVTYEFSRRFQLFDYRSFRKKLLGPFWPLYEILFVLIMILVISVIGAAAGDILRDTFALLAIVGTAFEGYGTITWGFLLVMVLPLLTYGVWQIVRSGEYSGG